eukprot:574173-Pleurochrysis_carterae.AAC.3
MRITTCPKSKLHFCIIEKSQKHDKVPNERYSQTVHSSSAIQIRLSSSSYDHASVHRVDGLLHTYLLRVAAGHFERARACCAAPRRERGDAVPMDRREDGETAAQNRGRTAYPANISETRMPPPDLQFQGHAGETRERTHDMSPNVDESLNATLQLDPSSLWCALQKQSMTNGMCESENADHQWRCHAVSKANRANAGSDLALLQKNLERSTAESSELQARVATLERQVDQYRGALKREQQRSALYEKILSAKQREIERMEDTPFKGQLASPLRTPLRDKMADGGRIPFSVSSAASAGSLAQSECKRGERSLRLAGRELLSDSRAVRRQELLLEGIVANEVLPNNMQSLFTWTKRSRLVPRGLFISLDRTTLIISDRPGAHRRPACRPRLPAQR